MNVTHSSQNNSAIWDEVGHQMLGSVFTILKLNDE